MSETIKLSLPIALTQLGQVAMMTTDVALSVGSAIMRSLPPRLLTSFCSAASSSGWDWPIADGIWPGHLAPVPQPLGPRAVSPTPPLTGALAPHD